MRNHGLHGLHRFFQSLMHSRLAWETAWSFALKATNAGLMFLSTVILARRLGVVGYGIYAYAYSLVTLLALPAHAGLPNIVVRETAKGLAQGRPDLVKGAWQWTGRVVVVLSLLVMGIGGPLFVLWQGGLKNTAGQTMAWALLLVPLITLGNLRGAALRGLQQVILGQLPEFVLRPGLFLLFIGGAALLWKETLSPPIAMMFHAVASLLAFVVGAWLLWRHTPNPVRYARPSTEAQRWLASGIIFALFVGFSVVNQQVSTVILGLFTTPDAVGRFRVAMQIATLAAFGLDAVNMVVAPRFADLWTRGEMAYLQRLVTRSAQVMSLISLLVTAVFMLGGRVFLRIVFGPEFDSSYIPLMVLLLGYGIDSAMGPAGMLLNMTGYEKETAVVMFWAAGLNIVLNMILVPIHRILGAAAAYAISIAIWKTSFWWLARRKLKINTRLLHLPK